MSSKRMLSLAGSALLAGGLLAGGIGWAAAQDHPMTDTGGAHPDGTGMMTDAASHEAMDGMMAHMMGDVMPDETEREGMTGMSPGQHSGSDDMMSAMMAHMMGGTMPGQAGNGMMGDTIEDHHTAMHAAVAEALGLTVDEFEAELEAGKMVPQIAEEQGVELKDLHDTVMSALDVQDG